MSAARNTTRGARIALVLGVIAVSLAARSRDGQTAAQATPPQPPAPAPTAATPAAPVTDSSKTAGDSVSAQGVPTLADSAQPSVTVEEAPVPSGTWPVDPATGQTLINGIPVVGKVFIQQKLDGLRKYESIKGHYVNEPLPPEAAVVGTSYTAPALHNTPRLRAIMAPSTLWSLDTKRASVANRFYR
jgi:hypothetical protein